MFYVDSMKLNWYLWWMFHIGIILMEVIVFYFKVSELRHVQPRRCLNLQEYASKKLMAEYGVNVQKFGVAETPEEAATVARHLSKLISYNVIVSV